jgi:GTP1/Obg family GTP-binding protein
MLPFMFQNPQSIVIKKYLFEMLGERYIKNEKFIDRLTSVVTTKEDYENLGTFITDIFEVGFIRAVDQYKEQLAKIGMKVNIVPEEKPHQGKKIFNQEEKSG